MKLTLVICSYNQDYYLERVLKAVSAQIILPEQVLIADDGSTDMSHSVFDKWAVGCSCPTAFLTQEHDGFRRAAILNEAIRKAIGDYIVFLDGDCIPHPFFIADHREIMRSDFFSGTFVQGHRSLIQERASLYFGKGHFARNLAKALITWQVNGIHNAFRLPFPIMRKRTDLAGIRGCNLGICREDLLAVNGYNEAFVGWGREDSELAVRLMNHGLKRLDVQGRACCYHLWHVSASRSQLRDNDRLLEEAIQKRAVRCEKGVCRSEENASK